MPPTTPARTHPRTGARTRSPAVSCRSRPGRAGPDRHPLPGRQRFAHPYQQAVAAGEGRVAGRHIPHPRQTPRQPRPAAAHLGQHPRRPRRRLVWPGRALDHPQQRLTSSVVVQPEHVRGQEEAQDRRHGGLRDPDRRDLLPPGDHGGPLRGGEPLRLEIRRENNAKNRPRSSAAFIFRTKLSPAPQSQSQSQ